MTYALPTTLNILQFVQEHIDGANSRLTDIPPERSRYYRGWRDAMQTMQNKLNEDPLLQSLGHTIAEQYAEIERLRQRESEYLDDAKRRVQRENHGI